MKFRQRSSAALLFAYFILSVFFSFLSFSQSASAEIPNNVVEAHYNKLGQIIGSNAGVVVKPNTTLPPGTSLAAFNGRNDKVDFVDLGINGIYGTIAGHGMCPNPDTPDISSLYGVYLIKGSDKTDLGVPVNACKKGAASFAGPDMVFNVAISQSTTTATVKQKITYRDTVQDKVLNYGSATVTLKKNGQFVAGYDENSRNTINTDSSGFITIRDLGVGSYEMRLVNVGTPANGGIPPLDKTVTFEITAADLGKVKTLADISSNCEECGTIDLVSCENSGGDFSFVVCPLLRMMNRGVEWLDSQISNLLYLNSSYYSGPDSKVRLVWENTRNIAYTILIPVTLIMIISTALGFGMFDPYTVRRAMPRLAVAIIFITLSYDICRIMIDVVNGIGQGAAGIVAAPFGGTDNLTLQKIFTPNIATDGLFLGGMIAGVTGAVFGFFTGGILASFLLVAFVSLFTIFTVLVVRQLIIIFLMVLAPLAVLSWIFPGNDKLWKLWWGSFSKLLLLYPIIMAFIVMGRAFASIAEFANADGITVTLIKIIAYIGPYFFIPKAMQFAGGAFANIAGMANDRGRGLFDRQRKYRAHKRKEAMESAKSGNRFRNARPGSLRAGLNTFAEYGLNAKEAGLDPRNMGVRMRTALSTSADDEAAKYAKESAAFRDFSSDDDRLWAARYTNAADIEAALIDVSPSRFAGNENASVRANAVAQILRAQRETGNETFQRARLRALSATGTAYQDANGEVNIGRMLEDINTVYGGDRTGAGKALGEMKGALLNSGQIAGNAGYGTLSTQLEDVYRGTTSLEDASLIIMDDAVESSPPSQVVYGKPASARAAAAAHARRISRLTESRNNNEAIINTGERDATGAPIMRAATDADIDRAVASAEGVLDAMNNASPVNARAFATGLMGVTIPGGGRNGGAATVRDMMDYRGSSEYYRQMRKTYSSEYADRASRGFGPPPGGGSAGPYGGPMPGGPPAGGGGPAA